MAANLVVQMTEHFVERAKEDIRRAQQRLRRAPEFMKKVAEREGIDHLTTSGNMQELLTEWSKALSINGNPQFTKRGYDGWVKGLAADTRMDKKAIEYALDNVDVQRLDYMANSKLRYGSNPQLDYILDDVQEFSGRLSNSVEQVDELKKIFNFF